ncbi:hypothetical protein GGI05_007724 [Coemansia sp. RSA 2603]|nr:hypothetical protein GGI05_007724 [Coemansia sp. RSA 2603]
MAIALALRSKQMNQEGNSEDAARLFAVSLEKMSLSLQDLDQIHDSRVRERLNVLRILLTPDTAISLKPYAEWQDAEPVVVPISDRHLHTAKLETMTATLQSTAAYGLDLMNQLFIIWLTLLGNMIVWTSAKFKRSNLPVILAQNLSSITTWCHSVALEWHVYEHALKFGCMLGAWLSYVDKETRFSRKVICSTAAILGAIARVTEQSTNDNPEQNDIK